MDKILIVDDNEQITSILATYAEKENLEPLVAFDGEEAFTLYEKEAQNIKIILLDVMMPKLDGFSLCKEIRKTSMVPIIMITARGEDFDKIMGLDIGADDYVVKPFRPKELVARVQRLVNRQRMMHFREPIASTQSPPTLVGLRSLSELSTGDQLGDNLDELPAQIEIAGYRFERFALRVTFDNQVVQLTQREFDLALLFFSNIGVLLSRDEIFKAVWKRSDVSNSRALDTHLHRVRSKLALSPERGFVLRPVYGFGYRFDCN